VFLGIQQGLSWSTSIFIMVDYAGRKHSGLAIGLNETFGYTAVAIFNEIASLMLDENDPRSGIYYFLLVWMVVALALSAFVLKESRPVVLKEENALRNTEAARFDVSAELKWPSGERVSASVARSAFVYTSFLNNSLMAVCQAGLMINFLAALVWGVLKIWMKEAEGMAWEPLEKSQIAHVLLCYGLCKGLLQFAFGLYGDRYGRKGELQYSNAPRAPPRAPPPPPSLCACFIQ
jgi:MFS family permease